MQPVLHNDKYYCKHRTRLPIIWAIWKPWTAWVSVVSVARKKTDIKNPILPAMKALFAWEVGVVYPIVDPHILTRFSPFGFMRSDFLLKYKKKTIILSENRYLPFWDETIFIGKPFTHQVEVASSLTGRTTTARTGCGVRHGYKETVNAENNHCLI